MNRRGFLGVLAAAPAAAPAVAASLVEDTVIGNATALLSGGIAKTSPDCNDDDLCEVQKSEAWDTQIWNKLKVIVSDGKIPKELDDALQQIVAQEIGPKYNFDVDIRVSRSMSLAGKIAAQRAREVERRRQRILAGPGRFGMMNVLGISLVDLKHLPLE